MRMTQTTLSGKEQEICLLDEPLNEGHVRAIKKTLESPYSLLLEEREKYSDSIYLPDWKELVAMSSVPASEIDPRGVLLEPATSYRMQAIRRGNANGIPASISCLTLTEDAEYVFGIRGGNVMRDAACIAPAGAIPYNTDSPLYDGIWQEMIEELGIRSDELDNVLLYGWQTDPELTKGVNFVFHANAARSYAQVHKLHREAFDVYQREKLKGASETGARRAIRTAGYPNTDAWEHTAIVFIKPEYIPEIVNERRVYHDGRPYQLLDIGRAPLIMRSALEAKK